MEIVHSSFIFTASAVEFCTNSVCRPGLFSFVLQSFRNRFGCLYHNSEGGITRQEQLQITPWYLPELGLIGKRSKKRQHAPVLEMKKSSLYIIIKTTLLQGKRRF